MRGRMSAYGAERGLGCRTSVKAGVLSIRHTSCNGLGPQLVALELVQISLHKAAGLDTLERHEDMEGAVVRRGGGRKETQDLRRERGGICSSSGQE